MNLSGLKPCSRFLRQFNFFYLPTLTTKNLTLIYSTILDYYELSPPEKITNLINQIYLRCLDELPATPNKPYLLFSPHDLAKYYYAVLSFQCQDELFYLNEFMRVFHDRLDQ